MRNYLNYPILLRSRARPSIYLRSVVARRTSYNIPIIHVSHSLMEASRDVFGEDVAQYPGRDPIPGRASVLSGSVGHSG